MFIWGAIPINREAAPRNGREMYQKFNAKAQSHKGAKGRRREDEKTGKWFCLVFLSSRFLFLCVQALKSHKIKRRRGASYVAKDINCVIAASTIFIGNSLAYYLKTVDASTPACYDEGRKVRRRI